MWVTGMALQLLLYDKYKLESLQGDGSRTRQEIPQTTSSKARACNYRLKVSDTEGKMTWRPLKHHSDTFLNLQKHWMVYKLTNIVWQELCEWTAFTNQPLNGMWGKWYYECGKFVVLLDSHVAVCDGETENQLNTIDLGAEPASCKFASMVDIS